MNPINLIAQRSQPLRGEVTLPGDKSLSHRAALFAALADGESRIDHFLVSGVTEAMLQSLTALGVAWQLEGETLRVQGRGLTGLRSPEQPLYCGGSATTLRMLAGALAASGAGAVLDGSESLRRRPMERIIDPLSRMGVQIESGGCVPLTIRERTGSSTLQPIHYEQPVASAQVKTCLLLAALAAGGPSTLVEPALSRDHSERMLASMGVELQAGESDGKPCLRVSPLQHALSPLQMEIPGDFSAAAFILVAALIVPGSEVWLRGVGLNPTRTGLLDALQAMGAPVVVRNLRQIAGEPVGDLWVRSGTLHGTQIGGEQVVAMIDEFPIFAVAAAFAYGATEVRQAEELRYKESDRIGSLCRKLSILGVETEEHPDGFVIDGRGELEGGATLNPSSDHRLAMSMAVAGLAARQPVTITGAEIIHESFPGFVDTLEALGANLEKI